VTQSFRIIDIASGAIAGTQSWPDAFSPIVLAGQRAEPVTSSINSVLGAFTAVGVGAAFTPFGNFNLSVWGTFVGSVVLERSFDGGTTYTQASFPDGTTPTLTAPMSGTWNEKEKGTAYRFRCSAFTSGTINWRLSQ
jgi:hypothetical protein